MKCEKEQHVECLLLNNIHKRLHEMLWRLENGIMVSMNQKNHESHKLEINVNKRSKGNENEKFSKADGIKRDIMGDELEDLAEKQKVKLCNTLN